MSRVYSRILLSTAVVLGLGSCASGSTHRPQPLPHVEASPTASAVPSAPINAARITAAAFGMHVLAVDGHPYPALQFGTARIWDMGTTWKDLQPTRTTSLTNASNPALGALDKIVATFTSHGAQPVLTLGMTPAWAAHPCQHRVAGVDWGVQTCAPAGNVSSSSNPWYIYVRAIASRYAGRVKYFELWNEPSLHNGYNDDVAVLAKMQATAQRILHRYGAQLLLPGVPFTNGPITNGINWLDHYLSLPGGTSFDIVGLHLYPSDEATKAGVGPEWAVETALPAVRAVLARHGVASRQIWNTETNVGRQPAHTGYGETPAGAGAVARTFILASENGIARTIWYAADDRSWGGTWLENSQLTGLSAAGEGYRTVRLLLIGKVARGCQTPPPNTPGLYVCRFGLPAGGATLIAVWTTAGSGTFSAPAGTAHLITAVGQRSHAAAGKTLTVTASPTYLTGSF